MKIKAPLIFVIFTIILSAPNAISQSQNYGSISYGKAVNISGKQRMLSQKMSKAYLLLTKGINNNEIKKELNSSKFIFEKQLEILTKNASTSNVKLSIKNVQKIWSEFKTIISSQPNFANSGDVMRLNTTLLKACHELVLSIEQSSNYNNQFFKDKNQDLVKIINTSGKQRMLSQRLCLYYTAVTMFPNEKTEYKKVLNQVFDEFDSVIGNLLISNHNTTELEEELGSVMSIWEKFQTNKRGFTNGDFPLEEVFTTTNQLTRSFNKITGIYEGLTSN